MLRFISGPFNFRSLESTKNWELLLQKKISLAWVTSLLWYIWHFLIKVNNVIIRREREYCLCRYINRTATYPQNWLNNEWILNSATSKSFYEMTFQNRIDSLIAVFQADNNTDSLVTQNFVEVVKILHTLQSENNSKN